MRSVLLGAAAAVCPPANFTSVEGFDVESYISKRWFIQQQQATVYLPASQNRCVYAEYAKAKSFWGYDIAVHNHAEDVAAPHKVHDSGKIICAKTLNADAGQFEVAPCFLPTFLAGPYWVIAYSEDDGYALVSGGPPTVEKAGGCVNDASKTNGAGMWIFTREQQRTDDVKETIKMVRSIATLKGFDVSAMNDVDHSGCTEAEMEPLMVV